MLQQKLKNFLKIENILFENRLNAFVVLIMHPHFYKSVFLMKSWSYWGGHTTGGSQVKKCQFLCFLNLTTQRNRLG